MAKRVNTKFLIILTSVVGAAVLAPVTTALRRSMARLCLGYDDHSQIDYRMDVSLPFLYRALKP